MYPIPSTEKLVETLQCRHCAVDFPITDKDLEFYDKISPKFDDFKYSIPVPTLCPDCRQQRRLSWRNERKLYKRKCDATGKDIISIYSPDKPYKVYQQEEWWSDHWDAMDYGRPYDFARPFFQQLDELMVEVPKLSLINDNGRGSQNCEYTNDMALSKDCYYCFEGGEHENCAYCHHCNNSENTLDSDEVFHSNECYQCVNGSRLFQCEYLIESTSCTDCKHGVRLVGCSNCFGCAGLADQSFHILNQPYSPAEYGAFLAKFQNSVEFRARFFEDFVNLKNSLQEDLTKPYYINSENVLWHAIFNSKNCVWSYLKNSEDSKYCINSDTLSHCYDVQCWKSELSYEWLTPDNSYQSLFTYWSWNNREILYCWDCHSCVHLFGCVGLRDKKYCILNKQYTQSEYEELVPRIIEHMKTTGEWGEFFPSSLSPFGYNETVANEYFPMSREAALVRGFVWSDYEAPFPKVEKIIPAAKLPDDIAAVPDDILNWAIECEVTGKPFRIVKLELEFYRKHGLPVPHLHPDVRHLDRMAMRSKKPLA